MKKQITLALIFGILLFGLISAHSDEDFSQAESIIQAGTECSQLTDSQLEIIGDYYMEQIHPGEAHEYMDEMMGGEGSESLRQMHIAMAYRFYCNGDATEYTSSGMMGMMYPTTTANSYQKPIYYTWFIPIALLLIIVLLGVMIFNQKKKR